MSPPLIANDDEEAVEKVEEALASGATKVVVVKNDNDTYTITVTFP